MVVRVSDPFASLVPMTYDDRPPVRPYVPPSPPDNGLGMGAGDRPRSANGSSMARMGEWHLNQTQALEWVGGVVSHLSPVHIKVLLVIILVIVALGLKSLLS